MAGEIVVHRPIGFDIDGRPFDCEVDGEPWPCAAAKPAENHITNDNEVALCGLPITWSIPADSSAPWCASCVERDG